MRFVGNNPSVPRRRSPWWLAIGGGALLTIGAGAALVPALDRQTDPSAPPPPATPGAVTPAEEPVPVAVPPPPGLPVVDYAPAPPGFPADPAPAAITAPTEALHPTTPVAAYTAPGGQPLALLAPTINEVELAMPIVERRPGWVAVLLPSANRRIAWVPSGGWSVVPLRDLLLVERQTHRLSWYRAGAMVRSWKVSLGTDATPTPLGRSFLLGRAPPPEHVYGGVDIFALGSVPEDPDAVPAGLRGAHIGLHSWYHDDELGENTTDGCIRLTASGQRQLLAELRPGTTVVVVDRLPDTGPAPGDSGGSARRPGA